ncbi:MAG: flagellar hook-length control protein FliK, partial [Desulfatirhabdiaceae bacterium]
VVLSALSDQSLSQWINPVQKESGNGALMQNTTIPPVAQGIAPVVLSARFESSGVEEGLQALDNPVGTGGRPSGKSGGVNQSSSRWTDLVPDRKDEGAVQENQFEATAPEFEVSENDQKQLIPVVSKESADQSEINASTVENLEAEADIFNMELMDDLSDYQHPSHPEKPDGLSNGFKFSDQVSLVHDVNGENKGLNPSNSISENRSHFSKPVDFPVIRQIVDHASIKLVEGRSEIRIELKPESLGHLTLQISSENNQISLKITAENYQVKDTIENQIGQLRVELQRKGMDIDTVHVDIFNSESTYSQSEHQGNAGTHHRKTGTPFESVVHDTETIAEELSETDSPHPILSKNRKLSCFV